MWWYAFTIALGLPLIGPIHPRIAIQENMGLVHHVAKKYEHKCHDSGYMCSHHTHREELVQIGTITLWNCIQKFDRTRNIAFSTYAHRALHNAMARYARPRKGSLKQHRFSVVHENTLRSHRRGPEEGVEGGLLEETMEDIQARGYNLTDHYFVQYKLQPFVCDACPPSRSGRARGGRTQID